MLKHVLALADGSEITSGIRGENAIARVTITETVNEGKDLNPGAVCPAMLEVEILTPGGDLHIPIGSDLTLYKVNIDSSYDQVGVFTVGKAFRPSANRYVITAYDRLCWLERDLTEWLAGLNGWPYSLQEFAQMVCNACDLSLDPKYFTNGEWPVQRFSATKVTGKQLMQWVGEASCRFCRAIPNGDVILDWYKDSETVISPGEEKYIFQDSFSCADYLTDPVDKVLIRTDTKDRGVAYGNGSNAYIITGNPLLASRYQESLQAVARVLYEKLHPHRYNPCKITVPVDAGVSCGDILRIRDRYGKESRMYVMQKTRCGEKDILECTGSPQRDSRHTQNSYTIEEMQNKVLELEKGIDGIWAENRDNSGQSASLQLSVDGLKTMAISQGYGVTADAERVSSVEQTAEGISVQVKNVYDDGVSAVSTATTYAFDEAGITVKKSGAQTKTQITEEAVSIYKNGKLTLSADSQGIKVENLYASGCLSIAERCRFEKYKSRRVGCFWIGG